MKTVPDHNLGGQLFLRSQGFLATRVLQDQFADGADAYRFEFVEGEHDNG